jgi:hypothetical protein
MAKLTAHDRQSHMAGSLVEIDIPLAELRKMIDALRDEELVQSVGPLIHSRGGATIHINGTKPPCRSASPANPASVTVPRGHPRRARALGSARARRPASPALGRARNRIALASAAPSACAAQALCGCLALFGFGERVFENADNALLHLSLVFWDQSNRRGQAPLCAGVLSEAATLMILLNQ